jgi:hypothetical protein
MVRPTEGCRHSRGLLPSHLRLRIPFLLGSARWSDPEADRHDSTHIFNIFADILDQPRWFLVREIPFVSIQVLQLIYAVCVIVTHSGCGIHSSSKYHWISVILLTVGLRLALPFWHFLSDTGTPGAGDNLISSVMAVQLAAFYGKQKPKHTMLMFMSYDVEELGLKGLRAFCRSV